MPLVENGKLVEDRYVRVDDDAPLPERVPVIVSAKRFLAEADALVRRDGSLGVLWPNDRRVAELKPWLGHLALIALEFPKFRDGRAYSQARLLRENFGFRGTLRATGDVLRDQFQLPGPRRFRFLRGEEARRRRSLRRERRPLQRVLSAGRRRPHFGLAAALAAAHGRCESLATTVSRSALGLPFRGMP